jgi:hypothetical protein
VRPTITGPITGGTHGWAFGASVTDLAEHGYEEAEYFLDGEAARYRLTTGDEYPFDGRWPIEVAATLPYRTRMVVRRPVDPTRANGTLIVSWNNVSNGYDAVVPLTPEVFDGGYTWVGVTAQKAGIDGFPFGEPLGLRTWDEERYGTLSIPDDDLSYDVFTQAAAALGPGRTANEVDPLQGITVQRLLATGISQSAKRLLTYYNAVHPVVGLFDAFFLIVSMGNGTRVSSETPGPRLDEIPEAFTAIVNLLPYSSHIVRTDLDTPVLVLNSESEAEKHFPVRQPDSDVYRLWEVTGSAHTSGATRDEGAARVTRDFGTPKVNPNIPPSARPNECSWGPAHEAALVHLQRWMTDGTPPPSLPRIEIAGDPPRVVRDEHGNGRGGIRMPYLEVPTAAHRGASLDDKPDLSGESVPFTDEQLRSLYPDHDAYVRRFEDAVQAGLDAGFLLPREAARLLASARDSGIPSLDDARKPGG